MKHPIRIEWMKPEGEAGKKANEKHSRASSQEAEKKFFFAIEQSQNKKIYYFSPRIELFFLFFPPPSDSTRLKKYLRAQWKVKMRLKIRGIFRG